jgi:membrane-associated phospholipid phosphatase
MVELPAYVTRLDPAGGAGRTRTLASQALARWRSPHQRRLALAIAAALGSALAFARVTEDYLTDDPLARWDVSLARWFVDHRSAAGLHVFRAITDLGSPAVSLGVAAVVCVLLFRARRIADAAFLPLVLGGAELLNLVLKLAFHRVRPEAGVVQLDTYSYPSGHAMVATATYGAFAYLLWGRARERHRRILLVAATAAIVFLISFSRVYLGVHYLSDVLGGVAAGATWLALAVAIHTGYGDRFAARFAGSRVDRLARRLTRA